MVKVNILNFYLVITYTYFHIKIQGRTSILYALENKITV